MIIEKDTILDIYFYVLKRKQRVTIYNDEVILSDGVYRFYYGKFPRAERI